MIAWPEFILGLIIGGEMAIFIEALLILSEREKGPR